MAMLLGLRLFISYARGGRAHSVAEQVQRHLMAQGAQVFRDETDVRAGELDALAAIERELLAAEAVVYLLADETLASSWQKSEALLARREHIPLLVLQLDGTPLPFEVLTHQPFAAQGRVETWLPRLGAAVQMACQGAARPATLGPRWRDTAAWSPERQAERAYLLHWLAGDFSDRNQRYTALAGQQQHCATPEARRKGLYHDTDLLLSLMGEAGLHAEPATEKPEPCKDVLYAYRRVLAHRPSGTPARLAVLGEPGAGKSFSLQRLFCALAEEALEQPGAPIPLFLPLGAWIRADWTLADLLDAHLRRPFRLDWAALRDAGRVVLLLDGLNEIPVGQRATKTQDVFAWLQDTRWAGVLLSCRARDFERRPLNLPLDTLTLEPLKPAQVLDFLERWEAAEHPPDIARQLAQERFWALAAGPKQASAAAKTWQTWQQAGATWTQFWEGAEIPRESPNVYGKTSEEKDRLWKHLRFEPRTLLRLASRPYWLELLARLPHLPAQRGQLMAVFIRYAYETGKKQCEKRHALDEVPERSAWEQGLQAVALALQGAGPAAHQPETDGAQTHLPRHALAAMLSEQVLEFAVATQVLREQEGQVFFAHQLQQEALAAVALLAQAQAGVPAHTWWPREAWWQRNGWEVVAELAGEQIAGEAQAVQRWVAWLAQAQPELAARVWQAADSPPLSTELRERLRSTWLPGMTDPTQWPRPEARAAIGRALAAFDLDNRPGVGLRPDGLPDIAWAEFNDGLPFIYQDAEHPGLPPFALARYPVTHRQFQAFVEAQDGYRGHRWWQGFEDQRQKAPRDAVWPDSNCPRECVNWFEAVAFCRWLTHRLGLPAGQVIRLPTEREWERAARGRSGWAYPGSVRGYVEGQANCDESELAGGADLQRTSAVGLYPQGGTPEGGLLDMAGNVLEWCADPYDLKDAEYAEFAVLARVCRGGSWVHYAADLRTSDRNPDRPNEGAYFLGFRVCRASPI